MERTRHGPGTTPKRVIGGHLLFSKDHEHRRGLRRVALYVLDETPGVLAADEDLERVTEREVWREGIVDDGIDDRLSEMLTRCCGRSLGLADHVDVDHLPRREAQAI